MSLVESDSYQMRYYDASDGEALARFMGDARNKVFLPAESEKEIASQVEIWNAYSRYKCGLTATYQQRRIGMAMIYLMPYRKVAHHGICHVVVSPKHLDDGVRESLVRNLVNLGNKYFSLERLQFELYGDEKLAAILEEQGFTPLFTQENYLTIGDRHISRTLWEKTVQ